MALAMSSPERRKAPRILVERIVYLNLQGNNGGIILNVSQGGLCFHSFVPVQEVEIVQFGLGNHGERTEGEGRLVWTDDSRKKGGLCFGDMSEEARDKLFEIISKPPAPVVLGSPPKRENLAPRDRYAIRIRLPLGRLFRVFRGFSGGLASGLVIAALIAGAFMSRRELGEFLVRLGEHLGGHPAAASQPVVQTQIAAASPMQEQVAPSAPQPTQQKGSSVRPFDSLLSMRRPAMQQNPQPAGIRTDTPSGVTVAASNRASAAPPAVADTTANSSMPPMVSLPKDLAAIPPGILPQSLTILPPRPAKQTVVETESSPSQGSGEIEQMYFEIGKFKQRFSAKEETDKLAKLGFPSTVLQKGWLWMDSYHVLVGPYRESADADLAHRNLAAHGFTARPFERGSRNFVLPARLTWRGRQIPVGNCVIKWESYIGEVRLKFEQHNQVMATAEAKWVSRDPQYERSAVAYINRGDGLRTLVEVQFEGMSRTLVFNK